MVVYRHSLNYLAFFNSWQGEGINGFVQDGCMALTEVAVPCFFLISGFFFLNRNYYEIAEYKNMLLKKGRTLLLPFVIWNLVGLLCLVVTQQPLSLSFVWDFILQLFNSKYYGPLWYVRDLMVLMLLVPLYQWIFRINHWILYLLVVIGLVWYWIPIDCGFLSSEGLLFFFLGGVLSRHEQALYQQVPRYLTVLFSLLWLYLCFFTPAFHYLHKCCTILGVICFWNLMEAPALYENEKIKYLAQYSFLIYVLHFYPLKVFKVLLGRAFFGNEWVATASYLILPILVVVLIIGMGMLMKRYVPKVYRVSVGGR